MAAILSRGRWVKLLSVSPVYVRDTDSVNFVHADVLAPTSVKTRWWRNSKWPTRSREILRLQLESQSAIYPINNHQAISNHQNDSTETRDAWIIYFKDYVRFRLIFNCSHCSVEQDYCDAIFFTCWHLYHIRDNILIIWLCFLVLVYPLSFLPNVYQLYQLISLCSRTRLWTTDGMSASYVPLVFLRGTTNMCLTSRAVAEPPTGPRFAASNLYPHSTHPF